MKKENIQTGANIQTILILLMVGLLALGISLATAKFRNNNTAQTPQKPGAEKMTNLPAPKYSEKPEMQIDVNKKYKAEIETSKGTMEVILDPSFAPMTVNNFVFLAREGFYDGVKFHRIIADFMIQSGDPFTKSELGVDSINWGVGGPGYAFEDENNDENYLKGTIAMANSGPNTNGSQFFITHEDLTDTLPKQYTIFGRIEDEQSMKVLDEIAATKVIPNAYGEVSFPAEEVTITTIRIAEL
ncbi:MAG TPA: peptidylprolyl isomerase [bacterium]|nr:peptidylprolyl isomerase [bacterium]